MLINHNLTQKVTTTDSIASRKDRSDQLWMEESVSRRRVFVTNLSYKTRWQALKAHMLQAGPVVRADILTTSSGRSKGSGLVEFETVAAATSAIETLTDTE